MNTIKNSFSKIKASDEFKDKLLKELQASQTKLNNSNEKTLSKSNVLNSLASPKEHLVTRKIYYKKYIAAAATFVILAGIVSFKLIIPGLEKGSTDSEVIAYAPQTEPATKSDQINKSYEKANNNNENISSQSSKSDISSNNSEANVTPKNTETNLTSKKIESDTPSVKTEIAITTKVESNIQPKANENNSNSKIIKDSASSTSEIPVTKNDAAPKTEVPLPSNYISNEKDSSVSLANSDKTSPINDTTALTSSAPPENINVIETTSIDSIYVPKIEIPKSSTFATAKMMPLIIYKGNVYIHSSIQTSSEDVQNLLGQKLGTTKNTIDEWSSKSAYSNELASNIGTTDVYSVKGYDETFRIMTNSKAEDGTNFTDFYECLNGITIKKGEDILSKLKLQDNVITAKFQTYDDWNNGTGTLYPIDNNDLLKNLLNEINLATLYFPEDVDASLEDYRNEYGYKQIYFDLKDGVKNVNFTIFRNGYVYYDSAKIYLKIDSNFAEELWNSLNMMKTN